MELGTMCPIAFFHRGTPEIVFSILRNPPKYENVCRPEKVDRWIEIQLLLNYCK
jgi:hypothetical protein